MFKLFKISLLIIAVGILFWSGADASAQETTSNQNPLPVEAMNPTVSAQQEVKLDEEVTAKNLEIKEPKILPTSKFYFLKSWSRGVQSALTFNPVKKAELKLKHSSEKLLEIRKMAEQANNPAVLQKATQEYQKEMEKIKTATLQIKERASGNEEVGKFLDKFTTQQVLQEKILEKLEQQVPTSTVEKIKEVREQHLENFGEVMQKLDDNQGKIKERLENTFQNIQGSDFKELNDMQILKRMEEKAPEQIKEQIRETRENTLRTFKEKLETMPLPAQEKLQSYIQETTASVAIKMELVEDIKSDLINKPELKQQLEKTRGAILEQSQNESESADYSSGMCLDNPQYQPGFCKDGRIVIVTNEKGLCPAAKCIRTGEKDIITEPLKTTPGSAQLYSSESAEGSIQSAPSTEIISTKEQPTTKTEKVCVGLWDPVCGKNGKTYSNKCWLNLAGQEIAYKGICKAELQSNSGASGGSSQPTSKPQSIKTTPPFLPGQDTNTPSSGGSSDGGYSQPINSQTCPVFISPAPGFCQGGKIISGEKNEMGCLLPAKCIMDTTSSNQGAGSVGIPTTQTQPVVPSADTSQGSSSWQNNQAQIQDVKTPTPQLPPPPPALP